jgi:hypothetical protein
MENPDSNQATLAYQFNIVTLGYLGTKTETISFDLAKSKGHIIPNWCFIFFGLWRIIGLTIFIRYILPLEASV